MWRNGDDKKVHMLNTTEVLLSHFMRGSSHTIYTKYAKYIYNWDWEWSLGAWFWDPCHLTVQVKLRMIELPWLWFEEDAMLAFFLRENLFVRSIWNVYFYLFLFPTELPRLWYPEVPCYWIFIAFEIVQYWFHLLMLLQQDW